MSEVDQCLSDVTRPLKVAEYIALGESGAFDDEKVELIRGRVVRVAPMGEKHVWAVQLMTNVLVEYFGESAWVRPALPLKADAYSMPEPDFALVRKTKKHAASGAFPKKALLLIEVAHSSLQFDRVVKAPLYAEGGSPEYWVVNTRDQTLEVFRKPKNGRWGQRFTLKATDSIRPVAFASIELPLSEFLNTRRH